MSQINNANTICNVCCENYNKSLNAKVVCEFSGCNYDACKTCVRTYLLGTTNDPHCMNCKNPWSTKFLVDNLNRSFVDNDFRKHRKNLLVEKEISRTPELMNLVERTKLIEEATEELHEIEKNYNEARKIFNELSKQVNEKKLEIYRIKSGEDSKEARKKFIMPCPGDNCKGYLSTQYKCEVCKLYTCPDCFEIIGHSKEEHHECKDDNLKSAELIKKETKGCPKCGVRIFKISGCDQMWCTECKVAFSWNTGKIVINGAIHNPHYYNYLQQNAGANAAPRNPGDVLCGGLVPYYGLNSINRWISRFSTNSYSQFLKSENENITKYFTQNKIKDIPQFVTIIINLHRHINHITNVDLVNSRNKVRNLQNHDDLTIQYILNRKTKQELSDAIFRNDNQRKKYNELLNIYELLSVVGVERFNAIYDFYMHGMLKEKNSDMKNFTKILTMFVEFINEYETLINYVNNQLIIISYTYNLTVGVYQFCNTQNSWININKKYKQSDLPKEKLEISKSDGKKKMKLSDNMEVETNTSSGGSTSQSTSNASCSYM